MEERKNARDGGQRGTDVSLRNVADHSVGTMEKTLPWLDLELLKSPALWD